MTYEQVIDVQNNISKKLKSITNGSDSHFNNCFIIDNPQELEEIYTSLIIRDNRPSLIDFSSGNGNFDILELTVTHRFVHAYIAVGGLTKETRKYSKTELRQETAANGFDYGGNNNFAVVMKPVIVYDLMLLPYPTIPYQDPTIKAIIELNIKLRKAVNFDEEKYSCLYMFVHTYKNEADIKPTPR